MPLGWETVARAVPNMGRNDRDDAYHIITISKAMLGHALSMSARRMQGYPEAEENHA